jgi:hypothetical protein
MTQQRWSAVDRYITDLLLPPDPSLDAALEASAAAGLPAHRVSPAQLLAADPRVSATAIQTVGPKSHDGFAIGLVTGGA